MKKLLLGILLPVLFVASCTKSSTTPSNSSNTTNNTTVLPTSVAAYTVDGITDVVMGTNTAGYVAATLPIVVSYHDSTQEVVTVSLSGQPAYIDVGVKTTIDGAGDTHTTTSPWKGIPTFSLPLSFSHNTSVNGYTPGVYPMTLTATTATGGTKTFNFNLTLLP